MALAEKVDQADRQQTSMRWAIGLPVLRIGLVAAASTATWGIARTFDPGVVFPPPAMLATLAMLPVNVVCLLLVIRLLRRSGRSVRGLLGFAPRRLAIDALQGLLWLVVLYVPFTATLMLVMWARYGDEIFIRMETVFFDPAAIPDLAPAAWVVIGILTVLTFAPLNAPVEELVYRGYAQGALARRIPIATAILLPALLFGLQHLWYAATPDAMLPFMCAFFVWGVGSGLIYHRQRRLMPLIFAHGFVNLAFTLPALLLPFFLSANGT